MADSTDDYHYAEDYSLAPLEDDCKLLGALLDDCVRTEVGEELFNKVERIRALAQCAAHMAQKHDTGASRVLSQRMADELMNMTLEEALPLTRALGHYLSLTGIAELHHRVRRARTQEKNPKSCDEMFERFVAEGMDPAVLHKAVSEQSVEIVLTAHPTQVLRRTLQYKHTKISALLQQNDRADLTSEEREMIIQDLVREVHSLWQTDELRRKRPTPVDEARGGLHIVEQSLWAAVPSFMRRLSNALKKHTGRELPLNVSPLKFGSWMGGDRDGNPNVTARVTMHVVYLGRWMAADLYLREVEALRFELSMNQCSDQVWKMAMDLLEDTEDGDQVARVQVTAMNTINDSDRTLPAGMIIGTQAVDPDLVQGNIEAEYMPDIPNTLPGQDPEGGSECEFPAAGETSPRESGYDSIDSSRRVSLAGDPRSNTKGLGGSSEHLAGMQAHAQVHTHPAEGGERNPPYPHSAPAGLWHHSVCSVPPSAHALL